MIRATLLQWNLTVCKELQLLNALLSMKVTLLGMITFFRGVDSNALAPISSTVGGITIASKLESLKAEASIFTNSELGANVILKDPDVHESNALVPKLVTPDGMVRGPRDVQDSNAESPILTRLLSGSKSTRQSLSQSLNAFEPIAVTEAGTKTYPSLSTLIQSSVVQVCPFPAAV